MEKLIELKSLLLALTGSVGTSELDTDAITVLLNMCLRLAGEAVTEVGAM